MRQTVSMCATMLILSVSSGHALGGEGLRLNDVDRMPNQLQGRLMLGTAIGNRHHDSGRDGPRIHSLSMMGDYYFNSPLGLGSEGGLRATSGLLLGTRATLWGNSASNGLSGIERRDAPLALPDIASENGATTYLGVGYTGLSNKGGWGISADFGLMASSPRAVRLGRVLNSSSSLDDTLRDVRWSPVLQLGASYSF